MMRLHLCLDLDLSEPADRLVRPELGLVAPLRARLARERSERVRATERALLGEVDGTAW